MTTHALIDRVVALHDQLQRQVDKAEKESDEIASQTKRARKDAAASKCARARLESELHQATIAQLRAEEEDDIFEMKIEWECKRAATLSRELEKLQARASSRSQLQAHVTASIDMWRERLTDRMAGSVESVKLSELREELEREKKSLEELRVAAAEQLKSATLEHDALLQAKKDVNDRIEAHRRMRSDTDRRRRELHRRQAEWRRTEETMLRAREENEMSSEELGQLLTTVAKGRVRIAELEEESRRVGVEGLR